MMANKTDVRKPEINLEIGGMYLLDTCYCIIPPPHKSVYLGRVNFKGKDRDVFRREKNSEENDRLYFILRNWEPLDWSDRGIEDPVIGTKFEMPYDKDNEYAVYMNLEGDISVRENLENEKSELSRILRKLEADLLK